MARIITIEKSMTYNLDEIMENMKCDYQTAVEIAWDYFNEARAESYEETDD